MLYFVYLDEFGHVGPFVSRNDPRYHDSPVFGLGGFILPEDRVRPFASWFYQLKCRLLEFEIKRCGQPAATWEKKGSALYTSRNVTEYPELRHATGRLLNKITREGGYTFYVGIEKDRSPQAHNARATYLAVLREAIKRLDQFAETIHDTRLVIVMDEHEDRSHILTEASRAMFGWQERRNIIEPPFEVESRRYQTCQCADWLCGLFGRLTAYRVAPNDFGDFAWAERYFGQRISQTQTRSSIRRSFSLPEC